VDCQYVKPGKGGAFARTKLKRIADGAVIDRTFRSSDTIETVRLEEREMQYMYSDGNLFYFMDNETFDQHPLSEGLVGDVMKFLKEGDTIKVKVDGNTPVTVELPIFVELAVVETDPGLRGDTASGGSKPAKLETGGVVQVPLFIKEGTVVKVDTRTGTYVERV
jgi:elongation factor P